MITNISGVIMMTKALKSSYFRIEKICWMEIDRNNCHKIRPPKKMSKQQRLVKLLIEYFLIKYT